MRVTAHARVTVAVQVLKGSWGSDCTIDQVHRQAAREVVEDLGALLSRHVSGFVGFIGTPEVTAVMVDSAHRSSTAPAVNHAPEPETVTIPKSRLVELEAEEAELGRVDRLLHEVDRGQGQERLELLTRVKLDLDELAAIRSLVVQGEDDAGRVQSLVDAVRELTQRSTREDFCAEIRQIAQRPGVTLQKHSWLHELANDLEANDLEANGANAPVIDGEFEEVSP
jgi:hypothetical protein